MKNAIITPPTKIVSPLEDNPIILKETNECRIVQFGTIKNLFVVHHFPTKREYGLLTLEDAEKFVNRRCWETAQESYLWRRGFVLKPKVEITDEEKEDAK